MIAGRRRNDVCTLNVRYVVQVINEPIEFLLKLLDSA
jgi:hypothetical protein